jgi:uncharacterized protein
MCPIGRLCTSGCAANDEMIAVDTNLLVYAHRRATPEHRNARKAIERAAAAKGGWGIPAPSLAEFWSVVTHPAATGRPSSPEQASGFIQALIEDGSARILRAGAGFGARLPRLAADLGISGVRIFDLQIALIAFENGARQIWTHDRSFVSVPGLRVIDPLQP